MRIKNGIQNTINIDLSKRMQLDMNINIQI